MLGVNQLDFLNYTTAFKGNYRKGPHKLRAILSTPTQANEFCSNLGGVSVIFGVPLDHPDKNSEELLEILQGSPYNDLAVETWLHSFYEFETLDDLLNDAVTCKALANNALMFRAVGMGKVTVGKLICGLAGLDPASYEDIGTVVASDLAMAAVAGSQPAMAAAVKSPVAMTAMAGSAIAMAAVAKSQIAMTAVAASQTAMAAIIGNSSALNAVVSSSTAMAAIIGNSTALNAVVSSQTAMAAVAASSTAMAAVAASSTAMTAVAKSYVAVAAIWKNNTAVQKVQANSTAWATFTGASSAVMGKAVATLAGLNPASYADMAAVAASSTAMTAVAGSATARNAITSSDTAKTALANSPLKKTTTSSNGSYGTVVSGRCFIISVKNNNSGNTSARTHYFRYVFSGSATSTTTVNFSATYAAAAQVNMFTDTNGISYYNNDSIPGLITYIPC